MSGSSATARPRSLTPAAQVRGWHWARAAAMIVAGLSLTLLMISMQPFHSGSMTEAAPSDGGNLVNQVGFSLLALLGAAAMAMLADRKQLAAVLDPAWLVIFACLALSALNALDPATAMRAVGFNLAILVAVLAVLAVPWSEADFRRAAAAAIGVAILLSYFGVLFMPTIAIHPAGGLEPQHEGLWRGVFSHKNVAGPAFAAFFYFGIYFLRSGQRWGGMAIAAASVLFIIGTGSRTTIGLVLIAGAIVLAGRLFDSRRLIVALLLATLLVAAVLTLGVAIEPRLGSLVAPLVGDASFTGRTTLWRYALEQIAANPWIGYGFDSFWLTPAVTGNFVPFDIEWDYRGIVNGHNNYLDLTLFMGLPAAAIVAWILCIRPLGHYLQAPQQGAGARFADLCMMILAFALLNSMLESSWFRRADPGWIMMILAITGMRMTRRRAFSF